VRPIFLHKSRLSPGSSTILLASSEDANGTPAHQQWYIHNPPQELRAHPCWSSFHALGNCWFRVHFARVPKNSDSAYLLIERVINEAFLLAK
jgi:hypothetical protein